MHTAGGDDPLACVGQPDRDAIPLLHAQRHEGARRLARQPKQLGIADGLPRFDDGRVAPITRRHFGQHLRQGLLLVLVNSVRHG
ncbi:hypothetical protein SDC9_189534 [bioreactor metagenome]|uniref:Uncharacterized protein n=1 Tax=bioreactor metagenome TaxID=1076179 RepID=A0A645HUW1_9ZZZZ